MSQFEINSKICKNCSFFQKEHGDGYGVCTKNIFGYGWLCLNDNEQKDIIILTNNGSTSSDEIKIKEIFGCIHFIQK